MSVQKVSKMMIESLSSSKLTGALPAVDGSALLNVPSFTKSASDPAIDSNPSSGLGTVWVNTTSGEMFSLTDATTDANVWTNIGSGSGDVEPWSFPGTLRGYTAGGYDQYNVIDQFNFASQNNAIDTGDLTLGRRGCSGQSSSTHGYTAGGGSGSGGGTGQNIIDKFSFVAGGNATDVGDLTLARREMSGSSSQTHGYVSGGGDSGNFIEKYSFSTNGNSIDIGDLLLVFKNHSGQTSETHGYATGGDGSTQATMITKYSHVSDGNATDVGDLITSGQNSTGNSSTTHGYVSNCGSSPYTTIEKFSFATDTNSTDVGDSTVSRYSTAGQSSTTHGHCSGGIPTVNVIDRFSFSTDGNAVDWGDLTQARWQCSGTHY